MPACEATVIEIEQQLKDEEDLDFQGLLSDKVVYLRGHWVPLAHTSRISTEDEGLNELAQDAM